MESQVRSATCVWAANLNSDSDWISKTHFNARQSSSLRMVSQRTYTKTSTSCLTERKQMQKKNTVQSGAVSTGREGRDKTVKEMPQLKYKIVRLKWILSQAWIWLPSTVVCPGKTKRIRMQLAKSQGQNQSISTNFLKQKCQITQKQSKH